MSNASNSYRLAHRIADQLISAGVETVVASPGFRNSPLVLALRKNKNINVISAIDERGAAYFALGIGKTSHKPVAILCTSGTAAANYYPAVMEANYSNVPLIVLTADRPAELVGTGANQCADQIHFFSNQVRHSANIEPSFDGDSDLAHAQYAVGKAVAIAISPAPGPVHINIRFREPFLPLPEDAAMVDSEEREKDFWKFLPSASGPSKEQAQAIEEVFNHSQRTMILVGPSEFPEERIRSIVNLAGFTIPVLAENVSGVVFGNSSVVAGKVDGVLEHMLHGELDPPDLVVRFGAPLISKPLSKLLKKFKPAQVIFDEFSEAREPDLYPSVFIQGGMDGWILQMKRWSSASDKNWREKILEINSKIETKLSKHLDSFPLTELSFHQKIESIVSENAHFFIGNSMPIRDFNLAFPCTKKNLRVHSNRGQSGIDGLIATATGTALAAKAETHAIIGDLSTLHDLSSFSLASILRNEINLTFWIMNNGGGEIFKIVSTAKSENPEWFTTPQNFDLSAVAKTFQIPYLRVHSLEDLESLASNKLTTPGVRLIEVIFDPKSNLESRKNFSPL